MNLRSVTLVMASLTLARAGNAQVCAGYLPVSRVAPSLTAGVDAAGGGSAFGVGIGAVGRRHFGGVVLSERGFGLGGSEFHGNGARRVASDHLVAAVTVGSTLTPIPSGGISVCGSAEAGVGFAYGSRPNHEGHYRGAVRLALGADLHAGRLRLLPTAGAALMLVHETEYEDDIVITGTHTLLPVTLGLGVSVARGITIQPRVILPLVGQYSRAFGAIVNWTMGGGR